MVSIAFLDHVSKHCGWEPNSHCATLRQAHQVQTFEPSQAYEYEESGGGRATKRLLKRSEYVVAASSTSDISSLPYGSASLITVQARTSGSTVKVLYRASHPVHDSQEEWYVSPQACVSEASVVLIATETPSRSAFASEQT